MNETLYSLKILIHSVKSDQGQSFRHKTSILKFCLWIPPLLFSWILYNTDKGGRDPGGGGGDGRGTLATILITKWTCKCTVYTMLMVQNGGTSTNTFIMHKILLLFTVVEQTLRVFTCIVYKQYKQYTLYTVCTRS